MDDHEFFSAIKNNFYTEKYGVFVLGLSHIGAKRHPKRYAYSVFITLN